MKPGRNKFPHRRLNPALREAYIAATLNRRPTSASLAVITGFIYGANLSTAMHAPRVVASPLNVGRLQEVARYLQFEGPLFVDEAEEAPR